METDYERIILVKPDVFIYKIPPRTTNRGYRAADWKLDEPDWTGRLRVVTRGKECSIKIEDKMTGQLFAKAPIDSYPGIAVESVQDSSRYFVIRIQDDNGRAAFIGIGFADRGDSFDLNVALQDHFKSIQKENEIEKQVESQEEDSQSKLDLSLKEGQTIKVNLNIAKKGGGTSRMKPKTSGTGILPPPPGGGIKIPGPPGLKVSPDLNASNLINRGGEATPATHSKSESNANDLLLSLDSLSMSPPKAVSADEELGCKAASQDKESVCNSADSKSDWAQF